MYAVYHGPDGIKKIAQKIHSLTAKLAEGLKQLDYTIENEYFFDTLRVNLGSRSKKEISENCQAKKINLRIFDDNSVGISLDETTTEADVEDLLEIFNLENLPPSPPLPTPLASSRETRPTQWLLYPL